MGGMVPSQPPALQTPTPLRYLGDSSLAITGQITGRSYLFAGRDSTLAVDERDVAGLLATGRFAPSSK
jgi:hypothetical protein